MVVVLDKDFFVDFSSLETIMGSMGKKNDNPELNITTSEEWNSLQEQDGLSVIDVYSKWAGPCSVMRPVILKAKAKVCTYEIPWTYNLSHNQKCEHDVAFHMSKFISIENKF